MNTGIRPDGNRVTAGNFLFLGRYIRSETVNRVNNREYVLEMISLIE